MFESAGDGRQDSEVYCGTTLIGKSIIWIGRLENGTSDEKA